MTPFPEQHQNVQPGKEAAMTPQPVYEDESYKPSGKMAGKTCIITGGDSGIGRAVALLFAKEGANVAIVYLNENLDASQTKQALDNTGAKCTLICADLRKKQSAQNVIDTVMREYNAIDVLINNAAVQFPQNSIEDIEEQQFIDTFESNIYSYFYMTKAALPHLKSGAAIVNTASVTAFAGNATLIDYSATKGAIVSFTRSLSESLVKKGIRVNAVAPGPVWTPLIVSSFSPQHVATFGQNVPMERAAQPYEIAPAFLFLAGSDSSFISGEIIHVNGGKIIN